MPPVKNKNCLQVWKLANVTLLPKVKQLLDPKKELCPISLNPAPSNIAEDFTVSDYINPALEEKVAPNQFGAIAGSSTVMDHKHGAEMTRSD